MPGRRGHSPSLVNTANDTLRKRVMALAGLFQAVSLVQQVAREGSIEQVPFQVSLSSLFTVDSQSTDEIYGGWSQLRRGLSTLCRQLDKRQRDLELTRYSVCLMFLERKLRRRSDLMEIILGGIDTASSQVEFFEVTHNNVVAKLADIYQSTVSTLSPRVMVSGTPAHLNNQDNANKIRALLLAGIRATVLWRQLGGRRLQLLIASRQLLTCAQSVMAELED